jgi:hypothetical protein
MAQAYDVAALAVRQRLAEQRPERLDVLRSARKRDVAVFSGTYDSVEEVLRRLGIAFQLDPPAKRLAEARIVFANCSQGPNATLRKAAEGFVRDGGWLVSTDWSLEGIVQACFPGTVRHKPGSNSQDEVVAVEPSLQSLWSEVVVLGADPQWWLETSSFPIEILDAEKVRVEAASHELLVRYDAPAVAVRFDWHAGQVYHVMSHLWLKRTRTPQRPRYAGPCTDFLRQGMRLSDESTARVLAEARAKPEAFNFATMQSAATSTELAARLCVEALSGATAPEPAGRGLLGAVRRLVK